MALCEMYQYRGIITVVEIRKRVSGQDKLNTDFRGGVR